MTTGYVRRTSISLCTRRGILDRLITQMYFPRERLNKRDYIFCAIADEKARKRLTGKASKGLRGATTYTFDIVLRGRNETPFFER